LIKAKELDVSKDEVKQIYEEDKEAENKKIITP
jgi:hypothetical protein